MSPEWNDVAAVAAAGFLKGLGFSSRVYLVLVLCSEMIA